MKALALAAFFALVVGPIAWILLTSFKGKQQIYVFPVVYLPKPFTMENYVELFRISNFGRYFLNSLLVSVIGSAAAMVIAIMGGYVMARFKFKGRGA